MNALALLLDNPSFIQDNWATLLVGAVIPIALFINQRALASRDKRFEAIDKEQDEQNKTLSSHAIQIRDTRAAAGECRVKLDLGSFPYTE